MAGVTHPSPSLQSAENHRKGGFGFFSKGAAALRLGRTVPGLPLGIPHFAAHWEGRASDWFFALPGHRGKGCRSSRPCWVSSSCLPVRGGRSEAQERALLGAGVMLGQGG